MALIANFLAVNVLSRTRVINNVQGSTYTVIYNSIKSNSLLDTRR
jgi:hypothetical protein